MKNIYIYMAKIIITEKQYNLIKESIDEDIHPSDAYRDMDDIQTIIDGKRGVGFIASLSPERLNEMVKKADDAGLNVFKIQRAKDAAYVIYADGYEKQARELVNIAQKYNGYLPASPKQGITPDEVYKIGRLLGYYRDSVIDFVTRKFDLEPDYFDNTDIYK